MSLLYIEEKIHDHKNKKNVIKVRNIRIIVHNFKVSTLSLH